MLFLNPQNVSLNDLTLDHVEAIAINRAADRLAVEYSDGGAFPVFADVPEQRVTITIARDLLADDDTLAAAAIPGAAFDLVFTTAPNASASGARTFNVAVVITAIEHTLTRAGRARQTIACLALSSDGAADPIAPAQAGGGK